jgi:hypothetical protein
MKNISALPDFLFGEKSIEIPLIRLDQLIEKLESYPAAF